MSGRIPLPDPCPAGGHEPAIVHRTGGKSANTHNRCGRCGRAIVRAEGLPWRVETLEEESVAWPPSPQTVYERSKSPQRVYGRTLCLGCNCEVDVVYVYSNSDDTIGLVDHWDAPDHRCPHAGLTIWTKELGWSEWRFRQRYAEADIIKLAPIEYPVCKDCGAVAHGNMTCRTCRGVMRAALCKPSVLLDALDAAGIETIPPCGPDEIQSFQRRLQPEEDVKPATKEEIYDADIAPLMSSILEICKARKIAMIADFALDGEGFHCTSAVLDDVCEPQPNQLQALELLRPRQHVAIAETHETLPDGTKRISIRRIS